MAQNTAISWGVASNNTFQDYASDVTGDRINGVSYVTGKLNIGFSQIPATSLFSADNDLIPDVISTQLANQTLTGRGGYDAYLAQFDASGDLNWVVSWGGPGMDSGLRVELDEAGNVYVCGFFTGMASFSSFANPATFVLTSSTGYNNTEGYVAKFSSSGQILWARSVGSPGDDGLFDLVNTPGGITCAFHYGAPSLLVGGVAFTSPFGKGLGVVQFNSDGVMNWYTIETSDQYQANWSDIYDNRMPALACYGESIYGIWSIAGNSLYHYQSTTNSGVFRDNGLDNDYDLEVFEMKGTNGARIRTRIFQSPTDKVAGLGITADCNQVYITASLESSFQGSGTLLSLENNPSGGGGLIIAFAVLNPSDLSDMGVYYFGATGSVDDTHPVEIMADNKGSVYLGGLAASPIEFSGSMVLFPVIKDSWIAQFNHLAALQDVAIISGNNNDCISGIGMLQDTQLLSCGTTQSSLPSLGITTSGQENSWLSMHPVLPLLSFDCCVSATPGILTVNKTELCPAEFLIAEVTGHSGWLSWQLSHDEGINWSTLSNNTSNPRTFAGTIDFWIRAMIITACDTLYTNSVFIEVKQSEVLVCPPNLILERNQFCQAVLPDLFASQPQDVIDHASNHSQQPPPGLISSSVQVMLSYTNDCNVQSTCSVSVILEDHAPPVLSCPVAPVLQAGQSCVTLLPDYRALVTKSDNCTPAESIILTQSPPPGTSMSGSQLMVNITASDASGNTASCSFMVSRQDITPPVISCLGTQMLMAGTSCSPNLPDYRSMISKSDNCTASNLLNTVQFPAPGSPVISGTTNVTLTVSDAAGNPSVCSFEVVRLDNLAPQLSCPENQFLHAEDNCYAVLPDYRNLVLLSDNCTNAQSITLVQSPAPGSLVFQGQSQVTITATDQAGNSGNCSFLVIKTDHIAPQVICPGNQVLALNLGCLATLPDYRTMASISDNCTSPNNLTLVQSPQPGSAVNSEWTVVEIRVLDQAGNEGICSFTVHAVDLTAPVISCPADQEVEAESNCGYFLPDYTGLALPQDNCASSGALTVVQSPAPGIWITDTVLTVSLTVTDQNGVQGSCSFLVKKTDHTSPVMDCPENIVSCENVIFYPIPVFTDNCELASYSIAPSGFGPGSVFPVGTTTVVIAAWDAAGNTSSCSFTVTVSDPAGCCLLDPVAGEIHVSDFTPCPGAAVDVALSGSSGQISWFKSNNGAQWTAMSESSVELPSMSVWDSLYLKAMVYYPGCDQVFTNEVSIVPVVVEPMVCPGDLILNTGTSCQADLPNVASYIMSTQPAGVVSLFQTPDAGVISAGAEVTLTMIDVCDQVSSCSFHVELADLLPPVFDQTWPAELTLPLDDGCGMEVPDLTGYSPVSDNCTPVNGIMMNQELLLWSPDTNTAIEKVRAWDASGNSSAVEIQILFEDQSPPDLECPQELVLLLTDNCTVKVPDLLGEVIVTDNCGVASWTQSIEINSDLQIGSHEIELVIIDYADLQSSCLITVQVVDAIAPVFQCPENQTISVVESCEVIVPDYLSQISITEACLAGAIQVPAPGTLLTPGVYPVVILATDQAGQSSSCTFELSVTDDFSPQFGEDIVLHSCESIVQIAEPQALENCSYLLTRIDDNGFELNDEFPIGTTTFTFVAVDPYGASDTLSVVLHVHGIPSLTLTSNEVSVCLNEGDFDLNELVVSDSPYTIDGPGVNSGVAVLSAAGIGLSDYTVTADNGFCSSQNIISLSVLESPHLNYSGPSAFCSNEAFISLDSEEEIIQWSCADERVQIATGVNSPDAFITVTEQGSYTLIVSSENGNFCSEEISVNLTFSTPPVSVDAGPDQLVYLSDHTVLSGTVNGMGEPLWSQIQGNGAIESPENAVTGVSSLAAGTHAFVLQLSNGVCPVLSDTVYVNVSGLVIPNGFSPNQDGSNDQFVIAGLEQMGPASFHVFNRWGQSVFFGDPYGNDWGGETDDGTKLQDDTYFYELRLVNEIFTGFIVLKR